MPDKATDGSPAEPGQLSPMPSSATASADKQPTIATSFHQFAFLPEEIRRLIWEQACIPTRMRFLLFPKSCSLPRVGLLDDPADAPNFNYHGIRDDLAVLIASSENFQNKWTVPGCFKFASFFGSPGRDVNRISGVCPEARDVYLSLTNQIEQRRARTQEGVHVNESFDIFRFSGGGSPRELTTFLLTMRPRLSPLNIAIDTGIGRRGANFLLIDEGKKAQHNLPRWLLKAIEWGREAKKGYGNSPATSLTPSIDDVMLNLQNLQAVFLLDHGIKLRRDASSGRRRRAKIRPKAHQYNSLVHGTKGCFYALSPGNEQIMKHWDVPAHVWPVLEETKRIIGSSDDDWKVHFYLMASINQRSRKV